MRSLDGTGEAEHPERLVELRVRYAQREPQLARPMLRFVGLVPSCACMQRRWKMPSITSSTCMSAGPAYSIT
jgi:hypothetical protein